MPTFLGPFFPPGCSPKGSLVAIRVMKHPATGGHALGTRSAAATASTHPHPVRPASGRTAMEGPWPAPLPGVGAPRASPPSQVPRSLARIELGPSPSAPEPQVTFPITPSRLPAWTPEGRSAKRSGAARRERGERPSSSPSFSATAAALTPETELAGAKRLSPLRVPAPSPAWRGTGKLAKAGGRVGAPGRERVPGPG